MLLSNSLIVQAFRIAMYFKTVILIIFSIRTILTEVLMYKVIETQKYYHFIIQCNLLTCIMYQYPIKMYFFLSTIVTPTRCSPFKTERQINVNCPPICNFFFKLRLSYTYELFFDSFFVYNRILFQKYLHTYVHLN